MKEAALVICPGRGTYNAPELGYLAKHHASRLDFIAQLDALRREAGQVSISDLDGAKKFSASTHMTGDNASLLIYGCALADFAAIDRERFDVVAVTGNSMGWYLSLACGGALDLTAGARLVNNMGVLMHESGAGGQIVYPLVDDDWRPDETKRDLVDRALEKIIDAPGAEIHISIDLGGMVVFAANDAGLDFLARELPKDDRFPMRLNHHAAFHSPLLDHIVPLAQERNSVSDFGAASIPMIDGKGRIWSPAAYDPAALYDYTLGEQINRTYDFTSAVDVAVKEFAPDRIIVLGPGTTLGPPVAQALIKSGWRGLSGKADFVARQKKDPPLLSMGMDDQRAIAVGERR